MAPDRSSQQKAERGESDAQHFQWSATSGAAPHKIASLGDSPILVVVQYEEQHLDKLLVREFPADEIATHEVGREVELVLWGRTRSLLHGIPTDPFNLDLLTNLKQMQKITDPTARGGRRELNFEKCSPK